MDLLWAPALKLERTDFLGAGKDANGKADYQGCGEFNPLLLVSQQQEDSFDKDQDKTARNRANAANRRVMVLIFRKGSRVDPELWPCPRVSEGAGACRKRFWSDGEQRRSTRLPAQQRQYQQSKDTFACRFYDRLAGVSPCERMLHVTQIRLYDPQGQFMPNACYQITIEGRVPYSGTATDEGIVVLRDIEVPVMCAVAWGSPPANGAEPDYIYGLNMYLTIDDKDVNEEATMKLNNLGYANSELAENVKLFQQDYRELGNPPLSDTGALDEATLQVLRAVYSQCVDNLRKTQVD